MSVEILINATPRETRAAVLENGVLQEIYVERVSRRGLVSNLYKGRVSRVLPGMQAAFVDIGLERTAFLHAADIAFMRSPDETMVALPAIDDIRRLVNQGDEILVQVIKDPIGTKGARLDHLRGAAFALSRVHASRGWRGRFHPHRGRGRAHAPQDRDHREHAFAGGGRLHRAHGGVRRFGGRRWPRTWPTSTSSGTHVRETSLRTKPGDIVHEDLPLTLRMLRDELARGVSRVLVDSARRAEAHDRVRARVHPGHRPPSSSCTPGRGRSSTCMASKRKSPRRSIARCS